ncbi:hemerythrin domain-containing protein [Methanoculleus sp.]|uniref:hemerythrin domain-containing protein n=1 Tax=Methanoculleus sp. TaxID=90427 RepID=UPI001BD482D9
MDQDIIEMIRQDHEQILKMLDDLEVHDRATSETYSVARGLLYSHMYGEETTIYERMRLEMYERIEDSLAEHNSIRIGLDRLDRIEITGTEWVPAIHDLKRRVQFHIDSEERLLRVAESFIDTSERFEIAERFRRAKGAQSGYTLA